MARALAASVAGFRRTTGDAALALAEAAPFQLRAFEIWDHDGMHGRTSSVGDARVARLLTAPMLAKLVTLGFPSCHVHKATAAILPTLACAPTLESLDMRYQQKPAVVRALADCTFPKLHSLYVAYNVLGNGETLPGLQTPSTRLSIQKNHLSSIGARALVERLHRLVSLDICDNVIGDDGAIAIATSKSAPTLQRLNLSSTHIGTDAIEQIISTAELRSLRVLNLSCNDIDTAGYRALAAAPWDLTELKVHYSENKHVGDYQPLFEPGWLVHGDSSEWFERRLDDDGNPVKIDAKIVAAAGAAARKAKTAAAAAEQAAIEARTRTFDPNQTYRIRERVRHPTHGDGDVVGVDAVSVSVKFVHGVEALALAPAGAAVSASVYTVSAIEDPTSDGAASGLPLMARQDRRWRSQRGDPHVPVPTRHAGPRRATELLVRIVPPIETISVNGLPIASRLRSG